MTAIGVERGWLYAEGAERQRLLGIIEKVCGWTVEVGAPIVMSPVDPDPGDLDRAAASVREVGEILAAHGKTYTTKVDATDTPGSRLRIGATLPRGKQATHVFLDGVKVKHDARTRVTNRGTEVTVRAAAGGVHTLVVTSN